MLTQTLTRGTALVFGASVTQCSRWSIIMTPRGGCLGGAFPGGVCVRGAEAALPGPRGKAPRPMRMSMFWNATVGSDVVMTSMSRSKPQSSSSILTPLSACDHSAHTRECCHGALEPAGPRVASPRRPPCCQCTAGARMLAGHDAQNRGRGRPGGGGPAARSVPSERAQCRGGAG